MMVRKRIIVKGNVQGVGYRAYVRQYAFNLDVQGLVRNLPDKTVEIFCEADERTLKKFIRFLDVKGDENDPFIIDVEQIAVFSENTKEYRVGKVPKTYRGFNVDYGSGLTKAEREAAERDEYTILAGQRLGQKVDCVGQKVEVVGQKVEVVGQKVDSMHDDLNKRFDGVHLQYQSFREQMAETNKRMAKSDEKFERMLEDNKKIMDRNKELMEDNRRAIDNNERLIDKFIEMVDRQLSREQT
jgi:acylphosphatase